MFLETTGSTVFFGEWLSQLTSKDSFVFAGCYYIPQAPTQCYPDTADVHIGTQPLFFFPSYMIYLFF